MKISTKGVIQSIAFTVLLCLSAARAIGIEIQSIEPVSVAGSGQPASSTGLSGGALMSANGQFVAFMSDAIDLTTNRFEGRDLQIYLRDLKSGNVRLVTQSLDGSGVGNANSSLLDLSADGRFVVFSTEANNLLQNDVGSQEGLFVRDMVQEKTFLVTAGRNGVRANGISKNARITPDGRFVVFESAAQDLVEGDTNAFTDIFVRELQTGVTRLVSSGYSDLTNRIGDAVSPAISDNGRFVAFVNVTTNVVGGRLSSVPEVFVKDLELGQTTWVSGKLRSASTNISSGTYFSYSPLLSRDGRHLYYVADPTHPVATNGFLVRFDTQLNESTLVSSGLFTPGRVDGDQSYRPSISADGKKIAFYGRGILPGKFATVGLFVWDADTRAIEGVSVDVTGKVSHLASGPQMSENGRYVVFSSTATNLVSSPVSGSNFQVYLRDLVNDQTHLVSKNRNGSGSVGEDLVFYSINGEGNTVFETSNTDLVEGDWNEAHDVFMWKGPTQPIELISARNQSLSTATASGQSVVGVDSVSSDGRFVLFTSFAPNLLSTNLQEVPNLFVRDTFARTNILVSGPHAGGIGNGLPSERKISGNGRFVVFTSSASNIVANDTNGATDVFVRDIQLGVTTLVSVSSNGIQSANGGSFFPSISDDGRYVSFESKATDLITGGVQHNAGSDIYLRDLQEGKTMLISASFAAPLTTGNNPSSHPFISPDGKKVVFQSAARDLKPDGSDLITQTSWFVKDVSTGETLRIFASTGEPSPEPFVTFDDAGKMIGLAANVSAIRNSLGIVLFDTSLRTNYVVCTNCQSPTISGNGQFLAYESNPARPNDRSEIRVHNLQTRESFRIATNNIKMVLPNGDLTSPRISQDGRFVVFQSRASNLVENDNNLFSDVFVYDQNLRRIELVSKSQSGGQTGNHASSFPIISDDGTTVVFQSFASDLIAGDFNKESDIFVARLVEGSPADSDNDQMNDNWETMHFGNLDRNGLEDFDQDGLLDWQEWKAGTDPKLAQSGLRTSISLVDTGEMAIRWESVAGKTYQVEVKDSVSGDWMALGNPIRAQGSTSVAIDVFHPGAHRFYRISVR